MTEEIEKNELANETSPYLLQHADNPVHWLPWGEAAFTKAREQEKLILLSIGYSTCHWCHVMAEESFENTEIAAFLNENFVCVKVDREERPDVDLTYMTFVQMSSGHGGWPLNVFLTPDLKPVYGGTYWPPKDAPGRAGFPRVCQEVLRSWHEEREKIIARSDSIVENLDKAFSAENLPEDTALLGVDFFPIVADYFGGQFDHHFGGFGGSPKFPRPSGLHLLLQLQERFAAEADSRAAFTLDMALTTLRAMARGGIHDHLGGGFHRYAVDAVWHVPHFEKMLYDQALLADCYVTAFRMTGRQEFRAPAEGVFQYLLRDLRLPDGAFASAEDADSCTNTDRKEKREGAFYVWTAQEIEKVLGPQDGPVFRFSYGVQREGNVRENSDPQGHLRGKNILFRARSTPKAVEQFKIADDEIEASLERGRQKLSQAREERVRPHRDDKVLTSWNALAISALSRAAGVLDAPNLLAAAGEALAFVRRELWPQKATLYRSWRGQLSGVEAFSADYAALIRAMLDYYEATFEQEALQDALALQEKMNDLFLDREQGGYFSTRASQNHAIFSMKEDTDGAEPSPNSLAAINLLRLGKMLDRQDFLETADKLFLAFTPHLKESAYSAPSLVEALDFRDRQGPRIVIAAKDAAEAKSLADVIRRNQPAGSVLLLAAPWLRSQNQTVAGMMTVSGEPAAFVCQNFTCQAPVSSPAALAKILDIDL